MKDYLTITEAAKRLGCSRQYVWELCKKGRIKHIKRKVTGQPRPMVFIPMSEVKKDTT